MYTRSMTIPKVDTFEQDIANEIKEKEADVVSISTASGDIGNTPLPPSDRSPALLVISIVFIIIVVVASVFGYLYYAKSKTPVQPLTENTAVTPSTTLLVTISPTLNQEIGSFVGSSVANDYGYTLTLTSYSPVFSYMLRSEDLYADELANALGQARDMSTTTLPFMFKDVTLNNQNMRVGTSGSSTIIYAFIGTNTLVFASTTEGIISVRSKTLTQ